MCVGCCCALCLARSVLYVVGCLSFVVLCVARCWLFVVWCLLAVCRSLYVVWCLGFGVSRVLFVGCGVSVAVC